MSKHSRPFFVKSLSSKIALVISITLVLMLIIINFFFMRLFSRLLMDSQESKAREITRMFSKINTPPLIRNDYYTLEQNVIELQKNRDIVSAQVYDSDLFLLTLSSNVIKGENNVMLRIYEEDIKNYEGGIIGHVTVGFDISDMVLFIKRYRLALYIASFIAVSITFMILLFLINIIVSRPLKLLLDSVNRISYGDLDHEVPVERADEIGVLAKDFNLMTKRLKSSASNLACIVDCMPSAIITVDRDKNILEWNKSASSLIGKGKEDAVSRNLFDVFPQTENYRHIIEQVMAEKKPYRIAREKLFTESRSIYELFFFPLRNEQAEGVVIRIDDITEREKRKLELIQAQKMESIGNLAGGLAHNLNNILAGIVGTTTFLEYKLENGQPVSSDVLKNKLKIIDDSGQRATELIKELMAISGKDKNIDYQVHDLNLLAANVIKMCQNTFDKAVEIIPRYNEEKALFLGNSNQIEQVILNICINAYHSMTVMRKQGENKGGRLTVSISRFRADDHFVAVHENASKRNYWMTSISDTGVGMNRDTISRIFDPFFTTKKESGGSGLGLSTVFTTVKQHGGIIDVYSEVGRGTTFRIYIPVKEEEDEKICRESQEDDLSLQKGKGSILIIDDEDSIRNISREMLKECGYDVYTAEDGISGLDLFREKSGEIILVIIDMIMPKRSGLEVLKDIKGINSCVKVIMSSGFMGENDSDLSLYGQADGFLSKPFTIKALCEAVHKVINRSDQEV